MLVLMVLLLCESRPFFLLPFPGMNADGRSALSKLQIQVSLQISEDSAQRRKRILFPADSDILIRKRLFVQDLLIQCLVTDKP